LTLISAVPDSQHQGIQPHLANWYHNSTFMDDNGIVDIRWCIRGAIDNSIQAAYVWFGRPEDDRWAPCLSKEKWAEYFSFTMLYLGFYIDTHLIIMAWPIDKCWL
jgi:hypothetical protein